MEYLGRKEFHELTQYTNVWKGRTHGYELLCILYLFAVSASFSKYMCVCMHIFNTAYLYR